MRDLEKYTTLFEVERIIIEDPIRIDDISIVIPAFNNQKNLNRLIYSFLSGKNESELPLEIIVVDNLSNPSLNIKNFANSKIPIHIFVCERRGAAAARNVGISRAKGKWICFCDDDCIATPNTLNGYLIDQNGSIAYNGSVIPYKNNILSNFYQAQGSLTPPPCKYKKLENIPMHIVTANSLVYKEALCKINGFDESFFIAAEDVDISIRLFKHGMISYAPHSIIVHDFEGGMRRFIKRFVRYGSGNRHLERKWKIERKPKYYKPKMNGITHQILSYLQYYSMIIGYKIIKNEQLSKPTQKYQR
ncbi:GT2 family glycosyltransferase [Dysgonomonas sp. PFB1-18]|uniref:glycosyltransferase family 2 protein n=1 Tax=unclassified Dysgonomonas TaxID=2630389 RepID=UPI0013D7B74A|nr:MULTISPECIES: glycosyltransferase [unclassified Dysgonomonas]MDH6310075.1 GT2 family glycosyltransferase [Dysgonomonas sp. PF1-14]MDH6339986.1 GT2 family glycosyltransferase [Dysgonomonas sp. PF1-16]MDH6381632.1 GT2 family glycosyltransferase [Dysgonomonas sp. PFB1-18]MDH6398730.1 GT2 family glycosyltransferase [Dysgonomonas sp. PF1-23]NDV93577.1 glycosyltransferase [Dysgonomonas sp. 521]